MRKCFANKLSDVQSDNESGNYGGENDFSSSDSEIVVNNFLIFFFTNRVII